MNVLTAVLALGGNLFYVFVYTRWLKRTTPQNIVIGGAAGAVPPLVGWAAVTGSLTLPALLLFLIVFFWTPPHFWALALLIKRRLRGRAACRCCRSCAASARRRGRSCCYSLVLVALTLVPFALGARRSSISSLALVLGGVFIWLAVRLRRDATPRRAAVLFHFSLLYLALLFAAMAVDPLL